MRADSTPPVAELKFNDPDNVIVQIQDVSYCGGSGALGSRCVNKPAPAPSGPPPIPVRTLNHFTIIVADVQRAVAFYQRVFGMRMQYNQGTEADWQKKIIPIVGIGKGPQFLAFAAGKEGGRIDHFCLGVEKFDAAERGETAGGPRRESGGSHARRSNPPSEELTFRAPDNILVQFQGDTYRGREASRQQCRQEQSRNCQISRRPETARSRPVSGARGNRGAGRLCGGSAGLQLRHPARISAHLRHGFRHTAARASERASRRASFSPLRQDLTKSKENLSQEPAVLRRERAREPPSRLPPPPPPPQFFSVTASACTGSMRVARRAGP